MAILRSKFLAILALMAAPAAAQETGDLSHSDFVITGAGEAAQANIAIMNPTPWPRYINDTTFNQDGVNAELVMQKLMTRNAKEASPTTVINIGMPAK